MDCLDVSCEHTDLIRLDWVCKNVRMSNSELDVLGIVGCRDNNARRFARVKKHYYSRRYEKSFY